MSILSQDISEARYNLTLEQQLELVGFKGYKGEYVWTFGILSGIWLKVIIEKEFVSISMMDDYWSYMEPRFHKKFSKSLADFDFIRLVIASETNKDLDLYEYIGKEIPK